MQQQKKTLEKLLPILPLDVKMSNNQVFDEIASDHRLEPKTLNKSGYYDVSIWRWTENRYVRLSYTDKLR